MEQRQKTLHMCRYGMDDLLWRVLTLADINVMSSTSIYLHVKDVHSGLNISMFVNMLFVIAVITILLSQWCSSYVLVKEWFRLL